MSENRYDVIVVGARCAGSPVAMLLATAGHRVLVVDRATFPSDTMSTHLVHPPGVAALRRWGLLDRVIATGMPADRHLRLRLRPVHPRRRPRAPPTPRSPTARGGPCWTSCSSTPRPRRAPRCGRGSPSPTCSSTTGG